MRQHSILPHSGLTFTESVIVSVAVSKIAVVLR